MSTSVDPWKCLFLNCTCCPHCGSKTFPWWQIAICSLKMCAAMLNAHLHEFVKPFSTEFNEARGKIFLGKTYNFKQASCWLFSLWNSCYSHIRTAWGTHSECFFFTVNLFTNSQVFVNHVSLLGLSTGDIWQVVLLDGNMERSGRLVLVSKRRS